MASSYSKIFELASKNSIGLSNTIRRDYGIPLDYSSVQESYEAALYYAQYNTLAYIGQPISVGDALYIVTDAENGYLKPVGFIPESDNASVSLTEDGKLSIKGFTAAPSATLPYKNSNGKLEWLAISTFGGGGGTSSNTKTVVQAAEGSAISVALDYNVDTSTYVYTLDVEFPIVPSYSITKETDTDNVVYKLTKDGTAIGDTIVVPKSYDDTVLTNKITSLESNTAKMQEDIFDQKDRLANVEAFFKDADTDQGEGENLINALNTLREIQDYVASDGEIANEVLQNTEAIKVLKGTGSGSIAKTISEAISAQETLNDGKFALKDSLTNLQSFVNETAAGILSDIEDLNTNKANSSSLDNYYTKAQVYTKQEVTDILTGFSDSTETAAGVKQQLDVHKDESATKFSELTAKNNQQDTIIESNQQAVNTINTQITNINDNINDITTSLTTLNQTDKVLLGLVEAETSAREVLAGELEVELVKLKAKDSSIEENLANFSTTAEVDSKITAALSAIDYTSINNAINANTKAIADETSRATTEEKRISDLISDNITTQKQTDSNQNTLIAANFQAIEWEKSDRITADTEIKALIGGSYSETSTVTDAINTAAQIGNEAKTAVTTLTNGKVAQLETGLLEEATERAAADTLLDTRLTKIELFFDGAASDRTENDKFINALDTLKEIQDYLDTDGSGVSDLIDKVDQNTLDIDELQDLLLGDNATLIQRLATDESLIIANTQDIATLLEIVEDYTEKGSIKTAINLAKEQADKGVVDAQGAKVAADNAQKDVDTLELVVSNLTEILNTVTATANSAVNGVSSLTTQVTTNSTDIENIIATVSTGNDSNANLRVAINALQMLTGDETKGNEKLRTDISNIASVVGNSSTGLTATKTIADGAAQLSSNNAGKISIIEADYLKAADTYIFNCGGASSVLHKIS